MIPSNSKKFEIALGAMVLLAIGTLTWITLQIRGDEPANAAEYHFVFDNAVGLVKDNPVTVAGVKVGRIRQIDVENRLARLTVHIDPQVVLHENAQIAIRAKSLLGEKYVALDPGAPPAAVLPRGARLQNRTPTVDIDQVIREVGTVMARVSQWTGDISRLDRLLSNVERIVQAAPQAAQIASQIDQLLKQLTTLAQSDTTLHDAKTVLAKLDRLLTTINAFDEEKLRRFLQLEGVRIRLFTDSDMQKRVDELEQSAGKFSRP